LPNRRTVDGIAMWGDVHALAAGEVSVRSACACSRGQRGVVTVPIWLTVSMVLLPVFSEKAEHASASKP
jgi:hypothetical protein